MTIYCENEVQMRRGLVFYAVLTMTAIYGSFLAVDVHSGFSGNMYSRTVRYLCILTCLILVFAAKDDAINKRDKKLMKLAFIFTAAAHLPLSAFATPCKNTSSELVFYCSWLYK